MKTKTILATLLLGLNVISSALAAGECKDMALDGMYVLKREKTVESKPLMYHLYVPVAENRSRVILLTSQGVINTEESFEHETYASVSETQNPGYCTIVWERKKGKNGSVHREFTITYGVDEQGNISAGGDKLSNGPTGFFVKVY